VYLNYKRKSTAGWSITAVLLDISGGVFSFLQQFINAAHDSKQLSLFHFAIFALFLDDKLVDDWSSFKGGNIGKLGLAIFSVVFDIIFIIQHYVLYRKSGRVDDGSNIVDITDEEDDLLSQTYRHNVN
jgi:cystinosin